MKAINLYFFLPIFRTIISFSSSNSPCTFDNASNSFGLEKRFYNDNEKSNYNCLRKIDKI